MVDYLVHLARSLGQWGYVIVGAGALLESAAFLGLLVPGESLVVVAGFLCAQGVFHMDVLIAAVFLGAVMGDSVSYELGHRLGRPWAVARAGRLGLTEERLERAESFFGRHGGKAVFLGRFVGFARALVPFVAGTADMPYPAFLLYNALGGAIWSSVIVLLGYFLGKEADRWVGRASGIVGGVVAGALLLMWAGWWIGHHEEEIRGWWNRLLQHRRVAAVWRGTRPAVAWVERRFSAGSYLGLQLTLGVIVFVGAAWIFGAITQDVLAGDPLTVVDVRIAGWLAAHRDPSVTAVLHAVSVAHDWRTILLIAACFAAWLTWKRHGRWLVQLLLIVPGGLLLRLGLHWAVRRPLPPATDLVAGAHRYGFPDPRTMAAILLWGSLAGFLAGRVGSWTPKTLLALLALFLVLLVALARIYLGAQYLSGVLGGATAGAAWLVLCYTAVTTYWRRKG